MERDPDEDVLIIELLKQMDEENRLKMFLESPMRFNTMKKKQMSKQKSQSH